MASCSLPSATLKSDYDIFINHRGPDVKKTLASHLYRRLLAYGLRVFLDQQELQEGENLTSQIEGAISTACVHVAIFSVRYAESKWCLDELVQMLKSGATLIPVFYYVKPSELRWTRGESGVYARALRDLEKKRRYEPNIVENWRQALSRVAEISGLELEACNRDEGELVDKVVQRVLKSVRKIPLHVATYPTGLDEKLQEFENMISLQKLGEVKVVGIVGIGGVGKTTLATEFFNRKRSDYDQSCFLFDVRGAAGRSSLYSLQNKLIKDLTSSDPKIDSIADGIEKFSHYRRVIRHALIILDDMNDVEEMDALFSPLKEVLPSGSLILITSRDTSVLLNQDIPVSSIYKLTGLHTEQSRELFCYHAFKQPYPVFGFEQMVMKFLDACEGLPLSLKVIGALLYSGNPQLDRWEAQLNRICKVLPKDIHSRLKLSYDNLDAEEKEIFLDIACFFVGYDRDKAIRIWEGSGWQGSIGLQNLENKCIVEIDRENCIRMHHQLRDLGRDLADKEPRRRLWCLTDHIFYHVLPGQSYVRGINMDISELSLPNTVEIGNLDMRGLQLLRVEGDLFESIPNLLRNSNLLWLRWDHPASIHGLYHGLCQYSSLPSSIPIKNLRVLEVVGWSSNDIQLETLWENESQAPLQLRELYIDHNLLQLPKSIGKLSHLEKIELRYITETLPEGFFHLRSLKHLRMSTSMELLPNAFGNLANLQYLHWTGCKNLQMLPFLGDLTNLQDLNLSGCSNLEMLPHSFGNLIRLKHLCLEGCPQLALSSKTLGNISTLESLDLSGCLKMEALPPQVAYQLSLEKLNLCNTNLKEFPSAIGNLSTLQVLRVDSFKEMPGLKHLDLHGTAIHELSFAKAVCANLQHLNVSSCCELVEVGALPTTLTLLNLKGCVALKKVTGLCGLEKLQELDIRECEAVEELPCLETLISLAHIQVSGCKTLKTIRGLAQATNLRIPSFDDSDSDWIEKRLFLDLRLWKEGLHGLQHEGENLLRWGNDLPFEGEDPFRQGNGVNGLQLEGQDVFKGQIELSLGSEDLLRQENGLQGNEWPLEDEDLEGLFSCGGTQQGNELPLGFEDPFRQGNGLQLEGEDLFRPGNELPLEGEDLSMQESGLQGNEWALRAKDLSRRGNVLYSEGEPLFRWGNGLRRCELQLEGKDIFRREYKRPLEGEDRFRQGTGLQGNEPSLEGEQIKDFPMWRNELPTDGDHHFRLCDGPQTFEQELEDANFFRQAIELQSQGEDIFGWGTNLQGNERSLGEEFFMCDDALQLGFEDFGLEDVDFNLWEWDEFEA